MSEPVRFCFGVHLHQPVGNFGYVFEQHVRDVYLPLLTAFAEREFLPVSLHVSGPLLEWLEEHDTRVLDVLGSLASAGKVELLLAGFYEPILASLPRADRLEQIGWMRDWLARRFGVQAHGLWLTERVWEPDLAADLAAADVRFALVDDRHFLVSGFSHDQLHAPFWTEHDGRRVALFPIDERLRYLIPFQTPDETARYLSELRARGDRLAVLADDGEKFGGWPGTYEWVYTQGWLDRFIGVMQGCRERGEMVLSTFSDALSGVPSGGLAYLPTASYREMEAWSLPAGPALRLARLERLLTGRLTGDDSALVRGSHWRNFLVKYPEANRMHKKMMALSALCRSRGDPSTARRAIGRAQCNDAYWHGVFGGLYLPFLRATVWENLAIAEEELRAGEPLAHEELDIDGDGNPEVWIHSHAFSAIVSPARGGAIEELTWFGPRINLANALTRRFESYHESARAPVGGPNATSDASEPAPGHDGETLHATTAAENPTPAPERASDTAPSIHDIEHGFTLDTLPPVDLDDRAIFVERVVRGSLTPADYAAANYVPLESAARSRMTWSVTATPEEVEIVLRAGETGFEKRLTFSTDGVVRAGFRWTAPESDPSAWFTTELSFDRDHAVDVSLGGEVWSHPIETVAKSERGLDRTLQGTSCLVRWPAALGAGSVDIAPPPGAPGR